MIEVQVGKDDAIDIALFESSRGQAFQKNMFAFHNPKSLCELGFKKSADSGLAKNAFSVRLNQHGATSQRDATLFIRTNPLFPHGTRNVAKHGSTVESL